MNIKSLLLGSAAAMVAVSGASAADAIIAAEPEPVEYVRVCDAFGEGYFYIPGTETCLKINGLVRTRVYGGSGSQTLTFTPAAPGVVGGAVVVVPAAFALATENNDSYRTAVRARVNLQTKSDTELGELHGYIRLQAENGGTPTTDATFGLDQGYLQLAGFLAGYTESAWNYSTNGGLSGFGGKGIYDGRYGYQQRNMLQYQFGSGNWFGAISLEDDADTTSWMPDIVGRLGAVIGGITVFGVVGYDQDNGNTDVTWQALGGAAAGAGSSEWGAKVGLNADVGAAGNVLVQGFYASGPTSYGANLGWVGQDWTAEWSVLAAYGHTLSETVSARVNGQYMGDFYGPTGASSGVDAWSVSGGFVWTPVTNFSVTLDGIYTKLDNAPAIFAGIDDDAYEFVLQIQRDF